MPYYLIVPYNLVNMKPTETEMKMKKLPNSNCNFEVLRRKDNKKQKKAQRRKRPLWILHRLFVVSVVINLVFIVSLSYLLAVVLRDDQVIEDCDTVEETFSSIVADKTHDYFRDLSIPEIHVLLRFLYGKANLGVSSNNFHNQTLHSTFIYSIELKPPVKQHVLASLNDPRVRPLRRARVVVFNGNTSTIDEYIVGPLDAHWTEMNIELVKHIDGSSVSYKFRPPTSIEIWEIHQLLKSERTLCNILKQLYGASLYNCKDKQGSTCLIPFMSYIPIPKGGKRMIWVMLYYDKEFYTLHPIDFHLLVDIDSLNASEWSIKSVWHGNKFYQSYENFSKQFKKMSKKNDRRRPYFPMDYNFGSLDHRNSKKSRQRSPQLVEIDGHRYRVFHQSVTYLKWCFSWRNSLVKGPTLYNVQFQNETIVYELGLQDAVVIYSGANPSFSTAAFSEIFTGLGSKTAGLVPGVDCPSHSTFLNVTVSVDDFHVGGVLPNAICIFEHNLARPLRRHSSSNNGHGDMFYGGLDSSVLVFRTIFVVTGKDYILDYVFYEDGTIKIHIFPTGYLLTTYSFPGELKYGTRVGENIVAPLHLHMFNLKIDMDIKGTRNRYETIDIGTELCDSCSDVYRNFQSNVHFHKYFLKRDTKQTELQAAYKYNISLPKYHVIYNGNSFNKYEERRGYRIHATGFIDKLLPEKNGFENSISWSRYQLAVTKRKESEEFSASQYSNVDFSSPSVNFADFINDDESIVDEDLVVWLTLGEYHIPRAEDIPNVVTSASDMSVTLSPFNYFDEDPSIESQDSIKLTPKDKNKLKKGLHVHQNEHTGKDSCAKKSHDFKHIENDGTDIFFPYI